ncbi:hypothetical protein ACOMHN_018919 [Nucella lapillus]
MMPNDSAVTVTESLGPFGRMEDAPSLLSRPDSTQRVAAYTTAVSAAGGSASGGGGSSSQHHEAYYLFFMGTVGIALNLLVIITILLRRTLRKMTSAFLIHACFLDLLKAAYCLPFGANLLGDASPSDCSFEGSSFVIIVTTTAFNMVAMICAEAYTFGENNVGGKSRGSFCCVLFGIIMVYVCSLILHLGPTLIGGYFDYNRDIGNCSFRLGQTTGYIANVMWICIVTLSLVGVAHFICKMYREIQENQPNRVSMLVRSSITIMDDSEGKRHSGNIRMLVKEASHRAKIFVLTVLAYIMCWYPLFLLVVIDVHFQVPPKVYQAFSFIAWSQGTLEPLILICFDRQLNLLARWVYCDRYKKYDASTLAYLLEQNRGPVPGEDLMGNNVTATAYHSIPYTDGGASAYPYQDEEDMSESSTRHLSTTPPGSHSPGSLRGGRHYYPSSQSPSLAEARRPITGSYSPGSAGEGRRLLRGSESPSLPEGRRRDADHVYGNHRHARQERVQHANVNVCDETD